MLLLPLSVIMTCSRVNTFMTWMCWSCNSFNCYWSVVFCRKVTSPVPGTVVSTGVFTFPTKERPVYCAAVILILGPLMKIRPQYQNTKASRHLISNATPKKGLILSDHTFSGPVVCTLKFEAARMRIRSFDVSNRMVRPSSCRNSDSNRYKFTSQ